MTREEILAWAKSLKPGDKVIYKTGSDNFSVLEVAKVTPSGWVKTTNGATFSQTTWRDSMVGRGCLWGEIIPVTEELLEKAKMQDDIRKEIEYRKEIKIKARNKIWEEYNNRFNLTYDRAAKILEFFDRLEQEGL